MSSVKKALCVCCACRHRLTAYNISQGFQSQQRGISIVARLCAQARPTYYEILGLENDASSSDIKAAYFKLSKTLHPDANPQNPGQHELFVQLNEAYGVLCKPSTRKDYDLSLLRPPVTEIRVQNYNASPDNPYGGHQRPDWYPRTHIFREGGGEGHEDYYGIRGLQRVNNAYVVYGCVVFIITGAICHYFVFRQSSQYATKRLNAKDRKIAELYNQAKERARVNGPKKQMELLRERHEEFRLKLKTMGSEV